jgi:hypothetical protein
MTDLTRSCATVRDRSFSTMHHKVWRARVRAASRVVVPRAHTHTCARAARQSCMVHGADGFAFVLHGDSNETRTLGEGGEGMGYAGIRNAIAVEFDTWYNPDAGDLFVDHVRWVGCGVCVACLSLSLAGARLLAGARFVTGPCARAVSKRTRTGPSRTRGTRASASPARGRSRTANCTLRRSCTITTSR